MSIKIFVVRENHEEGSYTNNECAFIDRKLAEYHCRLLAAKRPGWEALRGYRCYDIEELHLDMSRSIHSTDDPNGASQ